MRYICLRGEVRVTRYRECLNHGHCVQNQSGVATVPTYSQVPRSTSALKTCCGLLNRYRARGKGAGVRVYINNRFRGFVYLAPPKLELGTLASNIQYSHVNDFADILVAFSQIP